MSLRNVLKFVPNSTMPMAATMAINAIRNAYSNISWSARLLYQLKIWKHPSCQQYLSRLAFRTDRETPTSCRQHLLNTVEKLFNEKGFAGTSIRDIASASDMKIGSIYNFFTDKRGQLSAVLENAYEGLHEYVERAELTGDPGQDLRSLQWAITSYPQDCQMAHRVIPQEMVVDSEEMDRAIQLHLQRTRLKFVAVLRDGKQKGIFEDVDEEVYPFGLINALFNFFTSKALFFKLFPGRDPLRQFEEDLPFPTFNMMMKGLCRDVRSTAAPANKTVA